MQEPRMAHRQRTGFGALVHEARRKLGWTQEQLAVMAGVDNSLISKIEWSEVQANPSLRIKLSTLLGLSAEQLDQLDDSEELVEEFDELESAATHRDLMQNVAHAMRWNERIREYV